MGWLDSIFGWGGEDPVAVMQRQQAQARIDAENRAKAEAAARAEQQRLIDEAAAANAANQAAAAATPGNPAFVSARPEFEALYPAGFETTTIPEDFGGSTIEANIGRGRTAAQDLIANMLKRGTVSETGGAAATSALGTQEIGLRNRLDAIRDTMVANERAKLRGIVNPGYAAAEQTAAGGFDPGPYQGQVGAEVAAFTGGFPGAFEAAGGGGGFDLAALQAGGGSVTDPRNVSIDPYAVEGGKLSSGTGEYSAPAPKKKRSTSVF
jgi:hypothetical protein